MGETSRSQGDHPRLTNEDIRNDPWNIELWEDWANFDTFNDPELIPLLHAVSVEARGLDRRTDFGWLVLTGRSGTGKTYLARRLWKFWDKIIRHYKEPSCGANLLRRGLFVKWPAFLDECRRGDSSRLDEMIEAEFLVVDEISGVGEVKEWMTEKLFRLLDERMTPFGSARNPPKIKHTVWTSNEPIERLVDIYDLRIGSRFSRPGTQWIVHNEAIDYALRQQQQKGIKNGKTRSARSK